MLRKPPQGRPIHVQVGKRWRSSRLYQSSRQCLTVVTPASHGCAGSLSSRSGRPRRPALTRLAHPLQRRRVHHHGRQHRRCSQRGSTLRPRAPPSAWPTELPPAQPQRDQGPRASRSGPSTRRRDPYRGNHEGQPDQAGPVQPDGSVTVQPSSTGMTVDHNLMTGSRHIGGLRVSGDHDRPVQRRRDHRQQVRGPLRRGRDPPQPLPRLRSATASAC